MVRVPTRFVFLSLVLASPAAAQPAPAQPAPAPEQPAPEAEVTKETEPSTRISGEVRIRDEVKWGLYTPADPMGTTEVEFAHMRSRVQVDATISEHVSAVVQFQDVRNLGEGGSTTADAEGVDLKRGMIVIKNIADQPVSLELGRIVLFYGDQRLIGHLEWFDQGRTYDGGRGRFIQGDLGLDLFAVRIRETLAARDDQTLFGAHGEARNLLDGLTVQAYAFGLRDGLEPEMSMETSLIVTAGARAAFDNNAIDATCEAAAQFGDVYGQSLMAFAGALKAGYTATQVGVKPRVGIELTYASGDDDPADGDNKQFQTILPTNHLHYGYADLAAWTNHVGARLSVSVNPIDELTVSVDGHHLRLADPAGGWIHAGGGLTRPGDANAASDLGNELDITVKYKPTKGLVVLAGYSYFMAGGFIDDTGGGDDAQFGYLQVGTSF